ncbi:HD domain-containing protein [Catenuloplanes atrovinosus]|uniref:Signal transduction histidine kinase n=1 Tax=Catenuloplanes atrovinosus TaxID=137266 RepID=A0AAE3YRX1_9ACTN|nr:ATP-binding protein [Catenuloplanes atrovinosus]MDR7277239.1 signal transduction histidine kinase [Catenuloplanes atrovinosus]
MPSASDQTSYEASALWRRTLAEVPNDPWHDQRDRLRSAYQQFRRRVVPIAGDIALSMPMFTDHSIDHIDALWKTASIVCGDDFEVNPAEAFVLGGAFLMHDLGMGLSSYQNGMEEIRAHPIFAGLLARASDRLREVDPSADERRVAEHAENTALTEFLRRRHAERGPELLRTPLRLPDGSTDHLLQDSDLRLSWGDLIGKIAASHWRDVADLQRMFERPLGPLAEHPTEWTVDGLKIACILRLADAAHIDSSRAPSYLHALRRPDGVAVDHWVFQELMVSPYADGDRLVYTSKRPFTGEQAAAWWLAYETVNTVDSELRRVDALRADLGHLRFRVRSVAGAGAPGRFADYIRTDRWQPIDARIRVSDVNKLVGNLGGDKLYGNRPDIALRELVANASDATRARAARDEAEASAVTICLHDDGDGWVLTVSDQGIGMGPDTMVSVLTDFGHSHWRSADALIESPGLAGFAPTGRFGIGFFAVFMVADQVSVRSLAVDEAPRDTHVLEFTDGVAARPLLRVAEPAERLRQAGTVVTARLRLDPRSVKGLFRNSSRRLSHTEHLHALVLPLCALARVDIDVQGPDDARPVRLVSADDWMTISESELFDRLYRRPDDSYKQRLTLDVFHKRFLERSQTLRDESQRIVGRAVLASNWEGADGMALLALCQSHVYVGGLRSSTVQESLGAFAGDPLTADRLRSWPSAPPGLLTAWAESQAAELDDAGNESRHMIGMVARAFNAQAAGLPCASSAESLLDLPALHRWVADRQQIYLAPGGFFDCYPDGQHPLFLTRDGRELLFDDDCLIVSLYSAWNFPEEVLASPKDERFADAEPNGSGWDARVWWYDSGNFGSIGLVVKAISEEWGIDIPELLDLMDKRHLDDDGDGRCAVPVAGGGTERMEMIYLRRPSDGVEGTGR